MRPDDRRSKIEIRDKKTRLEDEFRIANFRFRRLDEVMDG